jgi:hypothetical protein
MSGIYREDRLLQLLPCVAGRHDHERHLWEGEGDGVAVQRENGQAVGPHTACSTFEIGGSVDSNDSVLALGNSDISFGVDGGEWGGDGADGGGWRR